jgi:hypothetical protein
MIKDIKEIYQLLKKVDLDYEVREEIKRLLNYEFSLATKKYFNLIAWECKDIIGGNSNTTPIRTIKIKLLHELNSIITKYPDGVDYVLIEDQPRMSKQRIKKIQEFIENYFFIKSASNSVNPYVPVANIKPVSATFKLSGTTKFEANLIDQYQREEMSKLNVKDKSRQRYTARKKTSVRFVQYLLNNNDLPQWTEYLNKRGIKADDYADCFAQCYVYYSNVISRKK